MFPALTPQVVILGLFNDSVSNICLIYQILLLFKLYIYKFWNEHRLNINDFFGKIVKIKKLQKITAFNNAKKAAA